jgi:3-deoxy-D-manno-octulosonic-acid transferase
VPRKPERFDEVAGLIERAGFKCLRRTQRPDGTASAPVSGNTVILGDTMGELRKFYSLATVIFVGRSLVPMGGSDPMEAAALGKPVIVGPYMDNFREPVAVLQAEDAVCTVRNPEELARAVGNLLENGDTALAMGHRARQVVRRCQGATARTVERIAQILSLMS